MRTQDSFYPRRVVMVSPEAFDVVYAINPHMRDERGELKKVDRAAARRQWAAVKSAYEKLGFECLVVPSSPKFPDMVFCANQTFPYRDSQGKNCVLMSRMHAAERKGEVEIFKKWFEERGYRAVELESQADLEGAGDLIWDHPRGRVFAGFGYRTDSRILNEAEKRVGAPFIQLELRDPRYYHLDTCLTVLNGETAAYVKEAFRPEGIATLRKCFSDLVEVDAAEAEKLLAGNGHCPNGRDVIIQNGCERTAGRFRDRGFAVHEVDTSEFIKSGGSVFCMKQMIY